MNVKPGGTKGGEVIFLVGAVLAIVGVWFFLDSVFVRTGGRGWITGMIGGVGTTTSMGLLFVPLFIGLVVLFFDAKKIAGWALTGIGVAILIVEILSRLRFEMQMKTSHLILLITMVAAGVGLMLRGYLLESRSEPESKTEA